MIQLYRIHNYTEELKDLEMIGLSQKSSNRNQLRDMSLSKLSPEHSNTR